MKTQPPYQHTQIGWLALASSLVPLVVLLPIMGTAGSVAPALIAAVVLVVTAGLFATLTVRVDSVELGLRFGLGLVRRRFALASVASFGEVRNPWHYGWGVRWYPGGTLYNVSGLSAVELVLNDGRRVRIGTDEPAELTRVLESHLGKPRPLDEFPVPSNDRRSKLLRRTAAAVIGLAVATLAALMVIQAKPARVSFTDDALVIENLFYGDTYRFAEIESVELLQRLPRVRAKTNGYALKGTLRGWFTLERLGSCKLFVEVDRPPFILIQARSGCVVLGGPDVPTTEHTLHLIRQRLVDAGRVPSR